MAQDDISGSRVPYAAPVAGEGHHFSVPNALKFGGRRAVVSGRKIECYAEKRIRDRETVPTKIATKGAKITKAFLLQLFVAYVLLVANSKVRDRETMVTIRNHLHCMGKDFVGGRPKGCYAMGKRVEAQSASRVGACQTGPSARRAGRGWTHVRTGPRNTAIGSGWRVTHATLLANAH